jgi:hypothetical protein
LKIPINNFILVAKRHFLSAKKRQPDLFAGLPGKAVIFFAICTSR